MRALRRLLIAVIVLVLVLDVAVVVRPRQVRAYLTHWKGAPSHTVAYGPYPVAGEPVLRMAVLGDIGDSGGRRDRTVAEVNRLAEDRPFDVVLLLGDNVYPAGDPTRLPATVFEPLTPVLDSGAKLLAILGNHDVMGGNGPAQMRALGMPGRWWAEELGDLLLVGLDSNADDFGEQRAWLRRTLAESDATWKVVAIHHSPYSAGYQGSSTEVREAFTPLFERYGVQLVLSGHDHDYQRSEVIGGVTYLVTGASAGTRRTSSEWFTARSFSWHHFTEVALFERQLVFRAVNQEGRVADEVVLEP